MPSVLAYHRPQSLDEAQKLASEKNAVLIGGGTLVIPQVLANPSSETEIIDLQSVGLAGITSESEGSETSIKIGAMSRLSDLINNDKIPHLLQELCSKELPSTLRTQATIEELSLSEVVKAYYSPDSLPLMPKFKYTKRIGYHSTNIYNPHRQQE